MPRFFSRDIHRFRPGELFSNLRLACNIYAYAHARKLGTIIRQGKVDTKIQ
jgi:hypothetical protein